MRNSILLLTLVALANLINAQSDYLFEDKIYLENIRTVQFGPIDAQHLFPVIALDRQSPFLLSFDDMDNKAKNYVYTVVHCNRDWTRSDLEPMEYIEGFPEDDVREYDFSFKTYANFVNYTLEVPNDYMRFTKSGNYLLIVYEYEDEKVVALTRRFVVYDNQVGVRSKLVRPMKVSQIHSHQEIDFIVDHTRLNVRSPMLELRATVIQNRRWDNAITDVAPKFVRSNESSFDYQGHITFPAGNEFRFLDLRSLRIPQSDIDYIAAVNDEYVEAELVPQISRKTKGVHLAYEDINGAYIIDNFDHRNPALNGDYIETLITYKVEQAYIADDVYLFGAITDWEAKPEFRLKYNPAISAYVGRFPLKMGYYNYFFATVPSDATRGEKPAPSIMKTEGSFADTENEYLILIYYHPFGSRYDQVIGSYQFNTRNP